MADRSIRIIKMPTGEAPEIVKEKWVGLVLPLIGVCGPRVRGQGVVSGKREEAFMEGHWVVNQAIAIRVLGEVHPLAAAWWMEQGYPAFGGSHFLFNAESAEEL